MKQCSKCKQNKDLAEFCKRSSSKDGFGILCKTCRQEINLLNKEKRQKWWKQYYNKKRKVICAKRIVYRLENNEKIRETKHKSYIKHKNKNKQKNQNKKNILKSNKHSISLSEYFNN